VKRSASVERVVAREKALAVRARLDRAVGAREDDLRDAGGGRDLAEQHRKPAVGRRGLEHRGEEPRVAAELDGSGGATGRRLPGEVPECDLGTQRAEAAPLRAAEDRGVAVGRVEDLPLAALELERDLAPLREQEVPGGEPRPRVGELDARPSPRAAHAAPLRGDAREDDPVVLEAPRAVGQSRQRAQVLRSDAADG